MALSDHEREVLAELEAQLRAEMGADASAEFSTSAPKVDAPDSSAAQPGADVDDAAPKPSEESGRPDAGAAGARSGHSSASRSAGQERVGNPVAQVKRLSIQHMLVGALLLVVGLGVIVAGVSMGAGVLSVLVGVVGFVCALFGALYAVTPAPVSGKGKRSPRR